MRCQTPGNKWILEGATGAEWNRAPDTRTARGQARLRSSKQVHSPLQPPEVRGSRSWSGSSPPRARAAQTLSLLQAQEPSLAGLARGGERSPHRTVSVPLPMEVGCQALTSGLSLCFQGACPERKRGRGNGVASLATCGGPSLCSPASFRDQESQGASYLTRGCHPPCFFLLHPLAPHPNHLHPEHGAHFVKTLDVTVFTGPTAHAGNSSSQI